MHSTISLKIYCKYCRLELLDSKEKSNEYHDSCFHEIEKYSSDNSNFLKQFYEFLPEHEVVMYLEKDTSFTSFGRFSYNKFHRFEQKLQLYHNQFDNNSKICIICLSKNNFISLLITELEYLPQFILNIGSLRYLSISFTKKSTAIAKLDLSHLKNLLALTITTSATLPFPRIHTPFQQSRIKFLQISHCGPNNIFTIPDGIESLFKLEILIIDGSIKEYPLSLCYLPKLRYLKLTNSHSNWHLSIPNSIVNLRQLQGLQIIGQVEKSGSHAVLKQVNSIEISFISVEKDDFHLKSLYVNGFALGYDELFSIIEPNKLQELYFITCAIDSISDELLAFHNVKHLDLSYNKIQEIPHFMQFLKNLENFNLENNCIKDFEILCNLGKIKQINLQNNAIENLPIESIQKNRRKFSLIDLRGNNLRIKGEFSFVKN